MMIHEDVGRSHGNLRHDLERIGETHQPRAAPMPAKVPEGERAIVEAEAMPEPRAAAVERDRGNENGVEKSGTQMLRRLSGSCMPSACRVPHGYSRLNFTKRMVRLRSEVMRGR